MNNIQKDKVKFRASKSWRDFREVIREKQKGRDYITNARLRKSANLHHCDLNAEHYTDISDESNFVFINNNTHSWIHEIYTYYRKDETVLDRLKEVLDKMIKLNQNS